MEKKFRNRSSMCTMLGYVHNTTKIRRIWDFKSGKTGQAVECSSVVFDKEENMHIEKTMEAVEFPDTTDEVQDETHEMNDTYSLENTSKEKISDFFCHAVKSLYEWLGDMCYTC